MDETLVVLAVALEMEGRQEQSPKASLRQVLLG